MKENCSHSFPLNCLNKRYTATWINRHSFHQSKNPLLSGVLKSVRIIQLCDKNVDNRHNYLCSLVVEIVCLAFLAFSFQSMQFDGLLLFTKISTRHIFSILFSEKHGCIFALLSPYLLVRVHRSSA